VALLQAAAARLGAYSDGKQPAIPTQASR